MEPEPTVQDEEWQRRLGYAPLASHYLETMRYYKSLVAVLSPHHEHWPPVPRKREGQYYDDFHWFCDYFGNAIGTAHLPICYPLEVGTQSNALRHALAHFIDRHDEFSHLRKRIDSEVKNGTLNTEIGQKSLETLGQLEECTNGLIDQLKQRTAQFPREKVYRPLPVSDLWIEEETPPIRTGKNQR